MHIVLAVAAAIVIAAFLAVGYIIFKAAGVF